MVKKAFVVATLICVSACTRVPPGYVGIHMSYAGSDRGVDSIPTTTGWVFYNPAWSTVLEYPTFVQTAVWSHDPGEGHPANEEITFSNADSMKVSVDVSLSYTLKPDKVPAFYVKFRTDDVEQFTHGFLRNVARDKFDQIGGKFHNEQILGDNAKFLADVRTALQKEVEPIGVVIEQFGLIGIPRLPEAVTNAINLKAVAQQIAIQKQNEIAQVEAEAKKEVAKAEGYAKAIALKSIADAEANERIAKSLTPTLVEAQKTLKWDGHLPQMTGGAMPFINLAGQVK